MYENELCFYEGLERVMCRVIRKRQLIETKKELRKGGYPTVMQDIPLFTYLL